MSAKIPIPSSEYEVIKQMAWSGLAGGYVWDWCAVEVKLN